MTNSTEATRSHPLDQDHVGRLLLKLALPTITAQVINAMYNLVDRMFIGRIAGVGNYALTGVGVCMPILLSVSAFAALIASGGAPRAGIAAGQKDEARAEKILGNCFSMLVILSIFLTVLILIFARPLLLFFGASENTVDYGHAYLQIYAFGTICVQLTLGLNAFITTQGQAKMAMLTVLLGAITNTVLDPILIFVFDMGVRGAAVATVFSQFLSMLWVLHFFLRGKSRWRLLRENLRIEPRIILPCLALGVSPFIMQFTEAALNVSFNSSLQRYGGDIAVGAMTILSSVMMFYYLPIAGLTQGSQPIISFNYGARQPVRIRRTFRILLILALSYSTVMWSISQFAPELFIRLFTDNEQLIQYTIGPMKTYMAASLLLGVQNACQSTFLGLGVASTSLFLAVLRKLVLLIPMIFILPQFLSNKVYAVYLAEPVSDFIAITVTLLLFIFKFRKILGRLEREPEVGEPLQAQ